MSKNFDFSTPDYDEWLRLVFDHSAGAEKKANHSWIWEDDVEIEVSDSTILISHMTRLCNDFMGSTSDYSLQQIDGGIWTLLSEPVRLSNHLADESVSLETRLLCISSMFEPYKNFVAPSQAAFTENCFDIWWDLVADGYWSCVNMKYKGDEIMARLFSEDYEKIPRVPDVNWEEINDDERSMLNQMLATLTKILDLGGDRCEQYALRGLGRLPHPQRAAVVQKFIDENADDWPEAGLNWLKQCRDGTMM